ncbi:MAG: hypothetical protein D6683_02320 [Actinomyces sp.]|nr:MAG: hypothetical protein D6683_02320 [Actinomyces sp.]
MRKRLGQQGRVALPGRRTVAAGAPVGVRVSGCTDGAVTLGLLGTGVAWVRHRRRSAPRGGGWSPPTDATTRVPGRRSHRAGSGVPVAARHR